MANLTIEERLRHYFLAMGAQPAAPIPNSPPGLSLIIGSEKIHVAVLEKDAFMQRSKIVESMLALSDLRPSADQLYLAAPRLLGTTIDAEVFRTHSIGLLLFDDRRIQEVVPAQRIQQPQTIPIPQNSDPELIRELEALKSMYVEVEQTITNLREEVKALQQSAASRPAPQQSIIPAAVVQAPARFAGSEAELPSFFVNNPWLEVLSRRGREENGTVAA